MEEYEMDANESGEAAPVASSTTEEPITEELAPTSEETLTTEPAVPSTEEEVVPWHKDPRWQKFQTERKTFETERETIQRELDTARRMAEFYQNQINETYNAPRQQEPQVPVPVYQPPSPAVPEILPPDQWQDNADFARYVDHKASLLEQRAAQIAQERVAATEQQLAAMEDIVIRTAYPDWDDVVKPVVADIFLTNAEGLILTDPRTQQPLVRNQALYRYIMAQPMPKKALYEYSMQITSQQRVNAGIKAGTQRATNAIVQKLVSRPKGPTSPGATESGTYTKPSGPPPPHTKAYDDWMKREGLL